MTNLHRIADRVLGRPLLITPEKAIIILDVLSGRIELGSMREDFEEMESRLALADAIMRPSAYRDSAQRDRAGNRMNTLSVSRGVAQITIDGSLVNRGAWVGASSGLVSYEGLHTQINDAVARDDVDSILLDINSPGGEAGGMFSIASAVRAARDKKMVVAFVNDMAASAAYGIASQATQIVVSPSSIVGSIGVVMMHVDRSGELATRGVKATLIHAGEHKVDGNPFGPLPDSVRTSLQTEVDKIYGLFVSAVAEGRGRKLSERAARATEARTFMGQDAIDAGLADVMASYADVMSALSKGRKVASSASTGGSARAEVALEVVAEDATPEPQAEAPAPVADQPMQEAPKVDANEIKARIKAITTCEEAKGREALATHLAFDTELTADAALAILSVAPRAAEEKPEPVAVAPAAAPVDPVVASNAYIERKQATGALGVAPLAETEQDRAKAGWSKAVKTANATIGAA